MKLLSALGEKYDVIMEMVDFLNGNFAYTETVRKIKNSFTESLDEIILLYTTKTTAVFRDLKAILQSEYPDIQLTGIDLGIPDVITADDDEKIRSKVFEAVERHQDSRLILSSAGRKDITQRIVDAGYIYGFYGYLSVTLPQEFHQLNESDKGMKTYQIVRKYPECLIVNWYPLSALLRKKYHLPETIQRDTQPGISEVRLSTEAELIQNFSALYSLPLMLIQRLKSEKIGVDKKNEYRDYNWLRALPKTDLHCHFGGAAGPEELKAIAEAILADSLVCERWKDKIQSVSKRLRSRSLEEELYKRKGVSQNHPLHYLKKYYKEIDSELPVFLINAVQLSILTVDEISRLMRYEPAIGGLETYMDAGNFGGSTLLQTENAMRIAMNYLLKASLKDNIRYIEIRVSPLNYCDAGLDISEVMKILMAASAQFMREHPIRVNFIIIATRHRDKSSVRKNIEASIEFSKNTSNAKDNFRNDTIHVPRVCGVDLAGKEEGFRPSQFKDLFEPLHRDFIKITIHAGETEGSNNIWEALYCLHANRIGHGLKLYQDERMMEYLRDFRISLEMCPTSNTKTCGYHDFSRANGNFSKCETAEAYPLLRYLEEGVGVTINTDNRGISNTTLTGEYLTACRLTKGGLSKWEILKIIRQGFVSSFLPLQEKNSLLHQVEREILSFLILDYLDV
ncbi:MAG: hypothetical protein HRF42_14020 [Candidatus Brocadia sp.]|jgi:adenosine deaminase